jgi:large subunit ribosomal protein L12
MQNIYAALLLHSAGKEINAEHIKKIVEAAGGTSDESSIKSLIASLHGVDIAKALEEAKSAPVAVAAAPAAEKKEEKKEEPKPELAAEGLASLFG